MSLSALSAGLLFVLAIPVVMQYRILPVTGTPYWLFGVLFVLLIIKVFVNIYPQVLGRKTPLISTVCLWGVLAIVLGGATITAIVDRHRVAPVWGVHDIILQQEAAMRYLVTGKNPYKETYFGTPVESFRYDELGQTAINPALYHFVMPPWYLVFPFPFYYLSNHTIGYFDGRIPLLFCMLGILLTLSVWFKDKVWGEISVILTALSPATINYFIEGRSDIFALFWLVVSLLLIDKKKYLWSGIFMALALLSKQTIWFAFPLWGFLLLRKRHDHVVLPVLICLGTALLGIAPFLLWDAQAFLQSVVLYLSAGGTTGYPVSGYGFSMVLYSLGVVKNLHDYYPFLYWQLGLGIPSIGLAWFMIKKQPRQSTWFIAYGIVLFIFWYFSRYFNNSHIAFISSIFVLGILKQYDEKTA